MDKSAEGPQAFNDIRYCIRCCMPETQEGIKFDEMGYMPSLSVIRAKNSYKLGRERTRAQETA